MSKRRHFWGRMTGTNTKSASAYHAAAKAVGGTKSTGLIVECNSWDVGVEVEARFVDGVTVFDIFYNWGNDDTSAVRAGRSDHRVPIASVRKETDGEIELGIVNTETMALSEIDLALRQVGTQLSMIDGYRKEIRRSIRNEH